MASDWFAEWLDPSSRANQLLDRSRIPNPGPYERRAVSARVNSVRNDGPDILRSVAQQLRLI